MGSLISSLLKTLVFIVVFLLKMSVKGIGVLIGILKIKIKKWKLCSAQKYING